MKGEQKVRLVESPCQVALLATAQQAHAGGLVRNRGTGSIGLQWLVSKSWAITKFGVRVEAEPPAVLHPAHLGNAVPRLSIRILTPIWKHDTVGELRRDVAYARGHHRGGDETPDAGGTEWMIESKLVSDPLAVDLGAPSHAVLFDPRVAEPKYHCVLEHVVGRG